MIYGVEGAYDGGTGGEKTAGAQYEDCFGCYLAQDAPHNRGADGYMNWGEPKQERRYEVEQFTGLKDKSGREIYEGDILKWMHYTFPITVCDFHSYRFMWGKDLLCRAYGEDGEVIGNIHEKP